MALKPNKRYVGKVLPGSSLVEVGSKCTPAYQVNLSCEDGDTTFNIWLTENSKKNAVKYFGVLGINEAKLSSSNYIEYQLGLDIEGAEVVFEAKDDPKFGIQVAWIGKKPSPNLAKDAAKFFGGSSTATATVDEKPVSDEDIPF